MGYRSTFVLAVDKAVITRCSIMDGNIPKILSKDHGVNRVEKNNSIYFDSPHERKMYAGYPLVEEFYEWMAWIEKEYSVSSYGYLEMGEDGEFNKKGEPDMFDIYPTSVITFPTGTHKEQ